MSRLSSGVIAGNVLSEHRLANFTGLTFIGNTWLLARSTCTRTVKLTPEQDDFIDELLKKGEYANASEAVGNAIRTLQQRPAYDALALERLRLSVQAGAVALDRGDYAEVDDTALDDYIDALAAPTGKP